MPITFVHDKRRRRLLASATGTVTIQDVVDFVSAQDAHGAWSDGVLLDASTSQAVGVEQDLATVAERMRVVARGRKRGPVAVVADPARVAEVTRIYVYLCAQVSGLTIGVFKDREEAEDWLDTIPLDPSDRMAPA
jgi:hypothetical protein